MLLWLLPCDTNNDTATSSIRSVDLGHVDPFDGTAEDVAVQQTWGLVQVDVYIHSIEIQVVLSQNNIRVNGQPYNTPHFFHNERNHIMVGQR